MSSFAWVIVDQALIRPSRGLLGQLEKSCQTHVTITVTFPKSWLGPASDEGQQRTPSNDFLEENVEPQIGHLKARGSFYYNFSVLLQFQQEQVTDLKKKLANVQKQEQKVTVMRWMCQIQH